MEIGEEWVYYIMGFTNCDWGYAINCIGKLEEGKRGYVLGNCDVIGSEEGTCDRIGGGDS